MPSRSRRRLNFAKDGAVTLVGRAGVGTTAVAGAVVTALLGAGAVGRIVCVRADGAMDGRDLLRAVGTVLDVVPPGDAVAVAAVLAEGPPTAILIDDADLAPSALSAVMDLPNARFVLTGRRSVVGTPVPVGPLADRDLARMIDGADPAPYAGLPAAVRIGGAVAGRPFAAVDALPPGAELLVGIPGGVPGVSGLGPEMRVPVPGRAIARRCVREALGIGAEVSTEALSAALRGRIDQARGLASDVIGGRDLDDLLFFGVAARRVVDPDLAALAAAAAGRLHLRYAEPDRAVEITSRATRERPPADRAAEAFVRWVEGDARFESGSGDEAHEAHKMAMRAFQDAGWRRAAGLLARRTAARWAMAGHAPRTRRWLGEARDSLSIAEDAAGWADTLRIAGDLSAGAGELMSAAALYDEAGAALDRALVADSGVARVRAAVRCGQAAVEAFRGEVAAAEDLLNGVVDVPGDPVGRAVVIWRLAELDARRNRLDGARTRLGEARRAFLDGGCFSGLVLVERLEGDVAALSGDCVGASRAWRRAATMCRVRRDVRGLRRVLRRMLAVEREGVPGRWVEEIQAQFDLVEVVLRVR